MLKEKQEKQIYVMRKWIQLENTREKIEDYLCDIGIKHVAIYGMGFWGERLYKTLRNSEKINIIYGLDRKAKDLPSELKLYLPKEAENVDEKIDSIIVTNVYGCGDIMKDLRNIYKNMRIVLLEDILDSLS